MPGHHRKIVLAIADGLRPDAITERSMPALASLIAQGWSAPRATTVRPSTTMAALGSLATGVEPRAHRLVVPAMRRLPAPRGIRPLPAALRRLGVPTTVIAPQLSPRARWLAGALLRLAGVSRTRFGPTGSARLGELAARHLGGNNRREFVVLYLNEADLAGHSWGWMSPGYFRALAALDQAMASLAPFAGDPETLVIVAADHGGGGVLPREHDHPHPANDAIPLALLGGQVSQGVASLPVRLLDVPPTVLHGFGGTPPASYQGRVLHEAFVRETAWV